MQLQDLQAAASHAAAARQELALLNEELEIFASNVEPVRSILSDLFDKAALLLQTLERLDKRTLSSS